jgi:hypothetical protein
MKLRHAALALLPVLGCSGESPSQSVSVEEGTSLTLNLAVASPSDLPTCVVALRGQVAYVESTYALVACVAPFTKWTPIPCDRAHFGAVAYAGDSGLLVACAGGKWTPVELPSGPESLEDLEGLSCELPHQASGITQVSPPQEDGVISLECVPTGECTVEPPPDLGEPCGTCGGGQVLCDATCSEPVLPPNYGEQCDVVIEENGHTQGWSSTIGCDGTCIGARTGGGK